MPKRNRDTETLFNQRKLHVWFAVTSLLMLGSCVAMVWQDFDRPWKAYQREVKEKQLEVARGRLQEAQEALDAPERAEEIEAARHALAFERDILRDDGGEALRKAAGRLAAEVQWLRGRLEEELEPDEAEARGLQLAWREAQLARYADGFARQARDATRLADLRRRGADLEIAVEAADVAVRAVKGRYDPAVYRYEHARGKLEEGATTEADVEAARRELNRIAGERDQAEIELSRKKAELEQVRLDITGIEVSLKAAEARVDRMLADATRAKQMVQGLSLKLEHNQWRNWPVLDFIDPSLEIQQVVLKDIHDNWNFATNVRVDRCTTCHLAVDLPDFGDPAVVETYAIPPWQRAHPALDLIAGSQSPHAKERTGCTVCHAGVGWSTDFARATHSPSSPEERAAWTEEHDWHPPHYVDFPMLPSEYVEGQCFKCHKEGLYRPPAYVERLDHGWTPQTRDDRLVYDPDGNPYVDPLENYGKQKLPEAPPPVDGDAVEVARATASWLRDRLGEHADLLDRENGEGADGAWRGVKSYDWEPETYLRGEDTVVTYGCQACHKIADLGEQVGYDDLPKVGPNLDYVADKVQAGWLERWIRVPERYRIDTRMPAFYYFVPKDHDWNPARDEEGNPVAVPVMDAHLYDARMREKLPEGNSTPRDLARMDVEILAMKSYLLAASGSRADPDDPAYDPAYAREPPPGDAERGRQAVSDYGCIACHIVPEVRRGDAWIADDGARFGGDPLRMPGPRLTSLGSKLKDRIWLDRWLADPRHYTPHTVMPDMRWRDELDESGSVVREAAQVRADVVDHLLSFRDESFEAIPDTVFATEDHEFYLADLFEEFFPRGLVGRRTLAKSELTGQAASLQRAEKLALVGEKLMARHGCFGCHNVTGHERDQPIGTELTKQGMKDLHQLDFAVVPKDVVPHTRWDFFRAKITWPRIYDVGKTKRWTDLLKMPRFNFRQDDRREDEVSTRAAVTAIVLGLVDEPIKSGALFQPNEYQRDVVLGRRVVQRYNCNNCHTIEGKMGLYWGDMVMGRGLDPATAPPNLFAQGHRTRPDWLMRWLIRPHDLRPLAVPRMPRFGLSEEESAALVNYFGRLGGRERRLTYQPESRIANRPYPEPVELALDGGTVRVETMEEEARLLFETVNCNKCHLPKGTPGADPTDGGVAPGLDLAENRLQRDWVRWLLNDPQHVINGTKMVAFWPAKRRYGRTVSANYEPFLFDLRYDEEFLRLWRSEDKDEQGEAETRLARRQMDAVVDYLLHHYRHPVAGEEPTR